MPATALARLLTRHQLQQKDVALELGVSPVTVSLWSTGKVKPIGLNLLALLALLRDYEPELTVEQLAGLEELRS